MQNYISAPWWKWSHPHQVKIQFFELFPHNLIVILRMGRKLGQWIQEHNKVETLSKDLSVWYVTTTTNW